MRTIQNAPSSAGVSEMPSSARISGVHRGELSLQAPVHSNCPHGLRMFSSFCPLRSFRAEISEYAWPLTRPGPPIGSPPDSVNVSEPGVSHVIKYLCLADRQTDRQTDRQRERAATERREVFKRR